MSKSSPAGVANDLLITNVSDTAYWVAHYRELETGRPDALFRDSLAKRLIGDHGKRISDSMGDMSRYTGWSVVARTVIIDRFIERLVREGVDAVVNLGAGLDTRPYRMALPETLEWIEADQASIIDHKSRVLAGETPRCRLTRVTVDLADSAKRRAFLDGVAPGAKRILVLTEGVIPYLSPENVDELARDLLARPRIQYWLAEYFHPRIYRYLRNAQRQAKMRNAPFRFYPEDWYGFFRKTGWVEKETRFASEIAEEFRRPMPMPVWARLIMKLMPARARREAARTFGFVLFERAR